MKKTKTAKVLCNFELCLYNRNDKCTLAEIRINDWGMCGECVLISLDEKFLKKQKQEQLGKMGK